MALSTVDPAFAYTHRRGRGRSTFDVRARSDATRSIEEEFVRRARARDSAATGRRPSHCERQKGEQKDKRAS